MKKLKPDVEATYQRKTQREHILDRPLMYMGEKDVVLKNINIFNEEGQNIVNKKIEYSPGLYKIFDEILTNATDHTKRDSTVSNIKVNITDECISVLNDGEGIPIVKHKEYDIYIPELIFAHLLTSSNYNDDEKRIVGGMNGIGAKLSAIFSNKFIIETIYNKKKYVQEFSNNLAIIGKPKITKYTRKGYTKVTFYPDFERLGITEISKSNYLLLKKRTYDASACTDKNITVWFNDTKIKVKDFQSYMDLYIGNKSQTPRIFQTINPRWELGICLTNGEKFKQISFVNGIYTSLGGTHIDHILSPIVKKITDIIQSKNKNVTIKNQYVKDNLMIFLKCSIENPDFTSQAKEEHITKVNKFGSRCNLTEDFIKKIIKLGITERVLIEAEAKERKTLNKTDGKKKTRITGIPKLNDASKAGTRESSKCRLILTEGDSAKATAVSGISVLGINRDYYGVFPAKGKLLNAREATVKQLMNNEEINNLKKILGLQQDKIYTSTDELRYGGIIIFTDQDNDGFHIKGLVMNLFHTFWPELLKIDNFITSIITPIVKAFKRNDEVCFYNMEEYKQWKENTNQTGWKIKYYKGLGTSTSTEAKEYFKNLKQNTITYEWTSNELNDEAMLLAFKKTEADSRKEWIKENTKNIPIPDSSIKKITFNNFIHKELVLFSIADVQRSIPHIMDGLKPSQRKVLFGCIKRNLTQEIKVSQLAGYISEHSAYHHGEASLLQTIISMAQNYIGSNNLNLLLPNGQFGTRLMGGKDSASARYIFTQLSTWTQKLFCTIDNNLLNYLNDDGKYIEPEYYVPTLPTLLINGSKGIGTGYSTTIPCYNPQDIINNLKLLMIDEQADLLSMDPWYKGFKGKIEKKENGNYITIGNYRIIDSTTIRILELPIHVWTQDYKEFLDSLIDKKYN